MKNKEFIIEQQKDFIQGLKNKTIDFINKIDKSEIETILLSGSVFRGDYFPGKFDGMVDLIVMKKMEATLRQKNFLDQIKNQKSRFIV